jgi:hypothetical protein
MSIQPHRSSHSRKTSLAMCLATALGVIASDATATCPSLVVTSCADSGAGTLRNTVACANSGDTVDLSTLACSNITLASHINIPQVNLSLTGPGANALAIDGGNNDRVFFHFMQDGGTLTISDLTITHGHYQGNGASGGCIHSGGSVTLLNSTISFCSVIGQNSQYVGGGGIYVHDDLTLVRSTITGNLAQGTQAGAHGGGALVENNFLAKYSTISDNIADAPSDARGGGLRAPGGDISLYFSTLSGNKAQVAAGIDANGNFDRPMTIKNSTISGNIASSQVGAINTQHPTTISNSTIAFNRASLSSGAVTASNAHLTLQSSIVADNLAGGVPFDIFVSAGTFTGANNLIFVSLPAPPPNTIDSCPRLGPLVNNGGPTLTHALLLASPALNHGSSAPGNTVDQRGAGFPRVASGTADIGAYERQLGATDDRLFKSGFEIGCDFE